MGNLGNLAYVKANTGSGGPCSKREGSAEEHSSKTKTGWGIIPNIHPSQARILSSDCYEVALLVAATSWATGIRRRHIRAMVNASRKANRSQFSYLRHCSRSLEKWRLTLQTKMGMNVESCTKTVSPRVYFSNKTRTIRSNGGE